MISPQRSILISGLLAEHPNMLEDLNYAEKTHLIFHINRCNIDNTLRFLFDTDVTPCVRCLNICLRQQPIYIFWFLVKFKADLPSGNNC